MEKEKEKKQEKNETEQKKDKVNLSNLPPPDFSSFILMLGSTALQHFGDLPNPFTNKIEKNLYLAKHTIDTIAMLEEKTRGNLTEKERKLIEGLLYDLRMKYVESTKK